MDKFHIPYICVLDFEATCDDPAIDHEIIEFPSVLLRFDPVAGQYAEVSRFDEFCKPLVTPVVTKFCFNLTGITQVQVDNGRNFPDVLRMHLTWLGEHISNFDPERPENVVNILTCGFWDLGQMMIAECKKWDLIPPRIYRHFINIKTCYETLYSKESMGMASMLKEQNIPLEGRHHNGLSDSLNIASIVKRMVTDGYDFNDSRCRDISSKLYEYSHTKEISMIWSWLRLKRAHPELTFPDVRPKRQKCNYCPKTAVNYKLVNGKAMEICEDGHF